MKLFDIDKLVDNLTGYIETKIELIKLDAKEELSQLIAKVLAYTIVVVFGLLAVVFVSFGLSALLNNYLESHYLGYLLVGLLYIILALVFFSIRHNIIDRVKSNSDQDSDKTDDL